MAKLCGLNHIATRECKDEMQDFAALCLKFLQSIFQCTAHDFAIIILMTSFIKIKIYIYINIGKSKAKVRAIKDVKLIYNFKIF